MKENKNNHTKIVEIIQGWWENPPEVVEEWVVSGKNKNKSQAQQEPQNAPRERRSSEGTGGRGRTREAVAGGRGAGRSGPRPEGNDRSGEKGRRSSSPRAATGNDGKKSDGERRERREPRISAAERAAKLAEEADAAAFNRPWWIYCAREHWWGVVHRISNEMLQAATNQLPHQGQE